MSRGSKKESSSRKKTSSTKRSHNSTTTSRTSMENMKYEIASEFGVKLGPDATSRANGKVGGEITKRLVDKGRNKMGGNNGQNS